MIGQYLGALRRLDDNTKLTPYGIFALRMTLVALWIAHFWFKVGFRGMPATEQFFASLGYPVWFAWADIIAELVAMALLIAGLYVRVTCIVMLAVLIPATLVWVPKGFYFVSGGYEMMLTWCVIQVVQALLGPGAFRVRLAAQGESFAAPAE